MNKILLFLLLLVVSCNQNQVKWASVSPSLDQRVAVLESLSERHDSLIQLLIANDTTQGATNQALREDIDNIFILIEEARTQAATDQGNVDLNISRIDLALAELDSRLSTQEDVNLNQQLQIDQIMSRLDNMDNLNSLQDDFLLSLHIDVCENSVRSDLLQLQINALGTLFSNLADAQSSTNGDIVNLSLLIATNTSNILSNEVRLTSAEHQLAVHSAILNDFNSRINILESQIVVLNSTDSSFVNELTIIRTLVNTLNINIQDININFTNLVTSQLADLTARVQQEELLSQNQEIINITVEERLSILEQAQIVNTNLLNIVMGDLAGVISASVNLTTIVNDVSNQLTNIFIEMTGSHFDLQLQIDNLNSQVSNLNILVNDQYNHIVNNTNSISDLNNLVSQINSTVVSNTLRIEALEVEIAVHTSSITNINNQMSLFVTKIADLEDGQVIFDNMLGLLQTQVIQNVINLDQLGIRVSLNETELEALRIVTVELETQFCFLLARIQYQEGRTDSIELRVAELERVQAIHSQLLTTVNSSIISINNFSMDLQVQINTLITNVTNLYFDIPGNLTDILFGFEMEINSINNQIVSMNERILELENFRISMMDSLNLINIRLSNLESVCVDCSLDDLRTQVNDLLVRVVGIEGRESLYLQSDDLTNINNSISGILTQLITHENDIGDILAQVNDNRTDIDLNSLRLSLVEQVNAQQTVLINLLSQSVAALEIEQANNDLRFGQLELLINHHFTLIQSQISTLVGVVGDNTIRIEELESEIVRIDISLAGLATLIENVNSGIEIIDPCGKSSHPYDEIIIKINGSFIAWFTQHTHDHHCGHGHHDHHRFEHLSALPDGDYVTTDKQKCNFTVANGSLFW